MNLFLDKFEDIDDAIIFLEALSKLKCSFKDIKKHEYREYLAMEIDRFVKAKCVSFNEDEGE